MNYKIEEKPTWWFIVISYGEYSGRYEEYVHIRANDREEAWRFLCQYADESEMTAPIQIYGEEGKKHLPKASLARYGSISETDWGDKSWSIGDAGLVEITPLKVVYINKYIKK